ncbi:MAG TPA: SDR family NAD(P)-dependent oxidoreductase [Dehalococcoidia bacterium]|nr:short-chain dehydrogenase [Chloroflexota bacterium]HJP27235.1 SDR family NAD(P)-dependent oxidoreductase [Dehalococcoidia bacterium]
MCHQNSQRLEAVAKKRSENRTQLCHNPGGGLSTGIPVQSKKISTKRCEITRLANKVAIVTGAGTRSANVAGVGVATAKVFASHGAKVLIVDMDETAAQTTQEAITATGGIASLFIADVAQEAGCKALVKAAIERYGKLDILMNSVGIGGIGMVTDVTEEHWNRVLDVDLKSAVFISKYAVPEMINNGGGSIINVSSVDGIRAAMTKNIPYAAAKGGMITVTKAMAVHHGRDNIRVNCIAPGLLYTSMTEAVDDRKRQLRRDLAPLGTEGEANDIAMAATFLASDESRWITGVLLPVDAGLMAAGPQSLLNNIIDDYEYV